MMVGQCELLRQLVKKLPHYPAKDCDTLYAETPMFPRWLGGAG